MPAGPIARLRKICLALPEAVEQETWDTPTFRVRGRIFAIVSARDGRPSCWCKAPPGAQAILVGADPARFFVPPYVGPRGWIGMHIDDRPDWAEVAALVRRSWAMTAPRRLQAHAGLNPAPGARIVRP
jgi:predicted DNA-binding protein (MmcQ/YjbR family)